MIKPLFEHEGYAQYTLGFLERHLDELDFLFDQRLVHFADPLVPWASVERLDQRIRAHAAALAAWGEPARAFARGQLTAAETALAAAFVLATLGAEADLHAAADALNTTPPELLPRLVAGLSHARGPDLAPALAPLAASPRPDVRAAVAAVLGGRRAPDTAILERLLHDPEPGVRAAAARAAATLGLREIAPALERQVAEAPEHTALLWPLVELGSRAAAAACRRALAGPTAAPDDARDALAVAGETSDAPLLRTPAPTPRSAHALGVLGAAAAVPWLLAMLAEDDEPLRAAAGAALARITGAGLHETADVAAPDEDEPGRPPVRVTRPSTSRAAWERWWLAHRTRFDDRTRYRGGVPLGARASIDEVAAPLTPLAERRRAAAEVRHLTRAATPFDPAGWVSEQKLAIRDWQML